MYAHNSTMVHMQYTYDSSEMHFYDERYKFNHGYTDRNMCIMSLVLCFDNCNVLESLKVPF